jgi:protoporphyrinogen oxidase
LSSEYTILGAGLAGLSSSYHLGHNRCRIFEKNIHAGGHIYSEVVDGFTWDQGPHVSFTKQEYVKELFAKSTDNEYLEYGVETINYYKGTWIPHPAQVNLYAISEPLRTECLNSFLNSRGNNKEKITANYKDWLVTAFGKRFTDNFPSVYTKKYWTTSAENLSTDWVGERVYFPDVNEVKQGFESPLDKKTHYITKVRYPQIGGYFSFAKKLFDGANINYGKKIEKIGFNNKVITFNDGIIQKYNKLISTLPLNYLISISDAPDEIKAAARELSCTQLLLINIITNHPTVRSENWIYVYDEDKYSTRINCSELLSPGNGVQGKSGIQVEVYFSKYREMTENPDAIAKAVINELIEMGLVENENSVDKYFTRWISWANIIFDHQRRKSLDLIFDWLANFGLNREHDDLEPATNWGIKSNINDKPGDLILAGRYGQWKYYWTDDCVLRGKFIGSGF